MTNIDLVKVLEECKSAKKIGVKQVLKSYLYHNLPGGICIFPIHKFVCIQDFRMLLTYIRLPKNPSQGLLFTLHGY